MTSRIIAALCAQVKSSDLKEVDAAQIELKQITDKCNEALRQSIYTSRLLASLRSWINDTSRHSQAWNSQAIAFGEKFAKDIILLSSKSSETCKIQIPSVQLRYGLPSVLQETLSGMLVIPVRHQKNKKRVWPQGEEEAKVEVIVREASATVHFRETEGKQDVESTFNDAYNTCLFALPSLDTMPTQGMLVEVSYNAKESIVPCRWWWGTEKDMVETSLNMLIQVIMRNLSSPLSKEQFAGLIALATLGSEDQAFENRNAKKTLYDVFNEQRRFMLHEFTEFNPLPLEFSFQHKAIL